MLITNNWLKASSLHVFCFLDVVLRDNGWLSISRWCKDTPLKRLPCLQTSAALERILADVNPTAPVVPVWTAGQQQQEAAFNAANCSVSPAVYYSPVVYHGFAALHSDVQAALAASTPQAADTKKGTSKPADCMFWRWHHALLVPITLCLLFKFQSVDTEFVGKTFCHARFVCGY